MPTKGTYADTALGATVEFTRDSDGILFIYCFRNLTGPSAEVAEIEVTHSCSTAVETIGDLPDFGTIEVEVNLDPDLPELNLGDPGDIVIKYPPKPGQVTGATRTGRAFVQSAPQTLPPRDAMTETVTFRLTGDLAFTAGS